MPDLPRSELLDEPRPVLLVDDSADDQFVLRRLLGKAGIAAPVLCFDDGKGVVEYLDSLRRRGWYEYPSVMFLDLKMPRMGGHEVLRWVRNRSEFGEMRVIVLSGSMLYADMRLAAELGADYYFEKFPSAETLRRLLIGATAPAESAAQACLR